MNKSTNPASRSLLVAVLALGSCFAAFAPTASATLLLEESFAYSPGALGAANGGTGFTLAFSSGGGGDPTSWTPGTPAAFTVAGGLSYSGLASSGGALNVAGPGDWSGSARRTFTSINTTTSQVWGSYLLNVSAVGDDGFEVKFGEGTNINWGLASGYKGSNDGNVSQTFSNPSNANPTGPAAFTIGTTFLVVWAYNNSADDGDFLVGDFLYWINPTLGVAPDVLNPTIYMNGGFIGDLGSMQIYGRNTTVTVDEIRLGTSFASVTPVPEPSSFAALAGAFGLLAAMTKRRRRTA